MERDLPLPAPRRREGEGRRGAGAAEGGGSSQVPALRPASGQPCLLPCPQNVLELTLYDKDVLDNDQLSQLLFDLRSLKPHQPHRHTFSLSHQVSGSACASNEPSPGRRGPGTGGLPISTGPASKTDPPPPCSNDPTELSHEHSFPEGSQHVGSLKAGALCVSVTAESSVSRRAPVHSLEQMELLVVVSLPCPVPTSSHNISLAF